MPSIWAVPLSADRIHEFFTYEPGADGSAPWGKPESATRFNWILNELGQIAAQNNAIEIANQVSE